MAKMKSAFSTSSSVRGWLRWREMSMPSSARASTAYSLGACPWEAWIPALATRTSPRPATNSRNSPSAIGLRQMLPVQTKRTFFTGTKPPAKFAAEGTKVPNKREQVNSWSPCVMW